VSQAVADLEATIGVRLLDRSPSGIAPTVYGEALLRRGADAFEALRQGIRDIELLADPTAGEVRIGCPETLTAGVLPAVIELFAAKYPRAIFHVVQANTGTLEFQELRARHVDLVLARLSRPLSEPDLQAEILFHDHLVIVAGTHSKWARRRKIELDELIDEPWILPPPDTLPRALVERAFRTKGLNAPEPRVASFSQHVRNRLLTSGDFLTVVPASVFHFTREHFPLKALPIALSIPPRPVAAVTLKNRTLPPLVKRFMEATREVLDCIPAPFGYRAK
jgi:DNA-binding transcriptional LysR family regulator